jgi:hypothetical protein
MEELPIAQSFQTVGQANLRDERITADQLVVSLPANRSCADVPHPSYALTIRGQVWHTAFPMTDSDDVDVVARVAELGVEEIGRLFVERARSGRPIGEHEWIDFAVDYGWNGLGGQLSVELRLQLILSAINAAGADDDQQLWVIADGPVDHLVGDDPAYARRFHAERNGNPGVGAMFDVMQRSLLEDDRGSSWWDDNFETWWDDYWRKRRQKDGA